MSDSGDSVKGIFVKFGADTHELKESLDAGKEALKEFGIDVNKIKEFLTGGAGLAVAFATIGKEAIEFGLEFEQGTQIIGRATGLVGPQLDDMTQSLRNIVASGAEQGVKDIAEAMSQLNIKLGVTGTELENATKAVAEFADVNRVDLKTAATDVSNILNKYGLSASSLEPLLDKLTLASQKSGASVASLSSGLLSAGAIFKSANLSIEDSISLLAGFEKGGVNTESAISGLRVALTGFQKEGKDAGEELRKLIEEIKNTVDPTEAANLAAEHFGRSTQEIFQAIRSGNVDIEGFNKVLENSEGVLRRTSEATKTNEEVFAELTNEVKGLAAEGFGSLLSVSKPILELLKVLIQGFESLPQPVKESAENIVILAGAVKVANVAIIALGGTTQLAFGPVVALGAVVITLAVALSELAKQQERQDAALEAQADAINKNIIATNDIIGKVTTLNENQKLSEDQIARLIALYPQLTGALKVNNTTLKEAVELTDKLNLRNAFKGFMDTAKAINEAQEKLDNYNKQLKIAGEQGANTVIYTRLIQETTKRIADLTVTSKNYENTVDAINKRLTEGTAPLAKVGENTEKASKNVQDLTNSLVVLTSQLKNGEVTATDALTKEIDLRRKVIDDIQKQGVQSGSLSKQQKSDIADQQTAVQALLDKLATGNSLVVDFNKQLGFVHGALEADAITQADAITNEIALRQQLIASILQEASTKGSVTPEQTAIIQTQKTEIQALTVEQNKLNDSWATADAIRTNQARDYVQSTTEINTANAEAMAVEARLLTGFDLYVSQVLKGNLAAKLSYQDTANTVVSTAKLMDSQFFTPIGAALAKGTDAWEAAGKGAVHALGAVVRGLGDVLTAMAAADFVKALAAAASIVGAAAAPGFFAASAIEATGAAAAYVTAGALSSYALGTDFSKAGIANVGEQGQEKIILPEGSKVIPNGDNAQSAYSEGGVTVPIVVQLGTETIFKAIYQATKNTTLLISSGAVV